MPGPTLLGHLAPGAEAWLFPATGVTPSVLGAFYQLGLLLLLFCSGAQIQAAHRRGEARTVGWVFAAGMIVPFLGGLALVHVWDLRPEWGPRGNAASFLLIFAIAMAVTSIPVISKIMHDLGILDTAFARVVLGVAVAEDIVLYVILAVSLGLAAGGPGALFGLPSLLGIGPGTVADMAYHVVATLAVLGTALAAGPRSTVRRRDGRLNVFRQASPVGYELALLLVVTLLCLFMGIEGFFGAFVAGIAAGETGASALNLAVALNARGGPGIVVASVAYGAGIIDQAFYAVLVILAIVTSLVAGSWLAHVPKERLLAGRRSPRPWRAGRASVPEASDP